MDKSLEEIAYAEYRRSVLLVVGMTAFASVPMWEDLSHTVRAAWENAVYAAVDESDKRNAAANGRRYKCGE